MSHSCHTITIPCMEQRPVYHTTRQLDTIQYSFKLMISLLAKITHDLLHTWLLSWVQNCKTQSFIFAPAAIASPYAMSQYCHILVFFFFASRNMSGYWDPHGYESILELNFCHKFDWIKRISVSLSNFGGFWVIYWLKSGIMSEAHPTICFLSLHISKTSSGDSSAYTAVWHVMIYKSFDFG